jgi:hypothetical protein
MDRLTFSDLLKDLRSADLWLTSLGLKSRNDRLRQCIDVVAIAAQAFEEFRRTRQPTKVGSMESYHFGIVEALEFSYVYRAFKDIDRQVIEPKLKRALSGPARPGLETAGNSDGRNTMFELALAADWKLRGANVQVGEPDIILICPEASFLFECKRPLRETGIRPSVKDAAEQVAQKLTAIDTFGAVAIAVAHVLDHGLDIFVTPAEEDIGKQLVQKRVDQLLESNYRRWSTTWFEPRVVAVLLHASFAAVFSGQLVRASGAVLWPRRDDVPAYSILAQAIAALYKENAIVGW